MREQSRSISRRQAQLLAIRRQRIRARRIRRIRLGLLTAALMLTALVILSGFQTPTEIVQGREKCYSAHTVAAGETLWEIAGQYAGQKADRAYLQEICELNHLSGSRIYYGQTLIIPYFSDAA